MPVKYTESSSSSEFRQGEIVTDLIEHRPIYRADQDESQPIPVEKIINRHVIIMTPDCDLLSDFKQRSGENPEHPNILQHTLLCELFDMEEIRGQVQGSDLWKRIRQNQDERYHRLPGGPVGDSPLAELPDLYLNFKRIFSVPTDSLYQAATSGNVRRIALVPIPFLQDLIHRFYAFHSRVAVPEEE